MRNELQIKTNLRSQVLTACRRLLSEINRDPATPTCGCCDRRYWAWKLIDFPEATFQRNLSALAWLMNQPEADGARSFLADTVKNGLLYTIRIQHRNGSFDQAYPYEQSYGATAFLLPDLLDAYLAVKEQCSPAECEQIETMLSRAGAFLQRRAELHGYISNHLAGAALALLKAGGFFCEDKYTAKAHEIVGSILSKQSAEGWYMEYGGADPGYQSLCMVYLAQVYRIAPEEELRASLAASLDFLQYFIHPDGTFGGEYGSRRTEIYYPGGIALLSEEFPAAAAMTARMLAAIENGETVTLADVDMGNTAPLLNSTIKALDWHKGKVDFKLPCTQNAIFKDFTEAGLLVRGSAKYYLVAGASNGGVLKVFNKKSKRLVLDDCGLAGLTASGKILSSQQTVLEGDWKADRDSLQINSDFYRIQTTLPGPFKFALLRIMNLTIMRIGLLNELVKKMLVGLLISGSRRLPLRRTRTVQLKASKVLISDKVEKTGSITLRELAYGGKFSSIHMASARYFTPAQLHMDEKKALDVEELNRSGSTEHSFEIDLN